MNPGSEVITVVLRKTSPDQSWGFRLQGGADFTTPLSVQSVSPGGLAENCGLCAGDAVLNINNRPSDELEHDEAKRMILMAGGQVTMLVQRGAVHVWKPKVTPMSQLRPGEIKPMGNPGEEPYVQRTSLAANKQESIAIGTGYNRAAKPFAGFGGGSSNFTPAPAPTAYSAPPPQSQYSAPYSEYQQPQPTSEQGGGYMPNMASLKLDSEKSSSGKQTNGTSDLHVPDSENNNKALSPTMLAIQLEGKPQLHRPVSPRYAALDTVIDTDNETSQSKQGYLSAPNPSAAATRSISPTLMLIQQEESGTSVSPVERNEVALQSSKYTMPARMVEQKDGEEVRYHGYMDHNKQSKSFKMLQAEVNDGNDTAPMPSGIRSVRAPTTKPPGERAQNSQYMTCKACGTLIAGVFVKISGEPMHPECFKCVDCGKNLKNQGYFRVSEKLYCDEHAKSAAQPPSGDMYAQPVYR